VGLGQDTDTALDRDAAAPAKAAADDAIDWLTSNFSRASADLRSYRSPSHSTVLSLP